MKIDVRSDGVGEYVISLGGVAHRLSERDLKELLVQASGILAPSSQVAKAAEAHRRVFMARLSDADDVGVQAFIQAADHEDVVVLLKVSENDDGLRRKLVNNMSETNRKIFLEDVAYTFQGDADAAAVRAALDRLERVVEALQTDGYDFY